MFNLRYPGQYYDTESGTNYNLFRTFDPPSGRYLQPDPIGKQGQVEFLSPGRSAGRCAVPTGHGSSMRDGRKREGSSV
ncbi:hypothetical protein GCM10027065_01150 [Rhodanobacter koreensis]